MSTLDRYIIKKFLGTFFYIIMAFIVISVVIDLAERVDDFIEHKAPISAIIFKYYLNFCIHFGNLLSGLLIFLTVVLVSSNMAQKSEVIATLSGGVSFNRYLRPYFIAATILVLLALLISHIILPRANAAKLEFESTYIKPTYYISDKNLHREVSSGEIAYCKTLSVEKRRATKFSLENWEEGVLVKKIMAETATFNAEKSEWKLKKGHTRYYHPNGKQSFKPFSVKDTVMNLVVEDFGYRSNISGAMTWSELNTFVEDLERKGFSDISEHLIEKHQRTSIPFSIYVFVLMAVSIASRKIRGGTGIHLILAVVIGFIYVFFQKVASVSATNAGVDPLVAVWIPNVVFLLIGIWLYIKAPK